MTTETVVESVTTPDTPREWTAPELQKWNETGEIPRLPAKQDSAPVKKEEKAVPDSAPDKKTAAASDSATDKKQEPHLKTKEDSERRFNELLEDNKALKRRLESLERGAPEKRDSKQESQPAPDAKVPSLKAYLEQFFAKPENRGKAYEDAVESWHESRLAAQSKQLEAEIRQRLADEASQRDLNSRVEDAKKRYPDWQERIAPAVKTIIEDKAIPVPVTGIINDSPVFVDLMYVLAEPSALADLIQTAKTNPAAAIRKIVLTEQLVMEELKKAAKTEEVKPSEEKDKAPEPKPRAPKPPAEVGGRNAATEDAATAAARSGNFSAFEAEQNRKYAAARS
jgi:hypothetical protein